MTLNDLSASWADIAPALGNHLWQSTLFAGVAALLTLLLRRNHAKVRYSLWLTASMKFLVPFSLLVGVGSHLGLSKAPALTQSGFSVVMQEIGQPFALPNPSAVAAPPTATTLAVLARLLPTLLLVAWFAGCAIVLVFWWLRWRRMTAAVRGAMPVQNGRELEALRRLERSAGIAKHIGLIIAPSAVEPGILGIFRPVLFLPARISDRLTDAQLEAILTHELCHVRRRDNLAAALHMLVEAVFWFHPLVWWIGARLVDERERACDEEVLSLGSDPQVYAEGILKVCEFYLESPLFCAAGVTGSNLKKRIEAIMNHRNAHNLGLATKLLFASLGVTVIVGPIVFGLLHATQSRTESVAQNAASVPLVFADISIKPNKTGEPMAGFTVKGRPMHAALFKPDRFMATNFTLLGLIHLAYGVQNSQISGGPDWLDSEKYDIEARLGSAAIDELSRLSPDERNQEHLRMIQALLVDRFKLALHRETRQVPGYALAIAKDGPKLHEAKTGDPYSNGLKDPRGRPVGAGTLVQPGPCKLVGQGVPIASLVGELSQQLDRSVVDETGLKGNYDFTLDCHKALRELGGSLLTVLPEQLGLELKEQTLPVEMLVIDHAEQVTADESSPPQSQTQNAAAPLFESASIKPNTSGNAVRAQSTSSTSPVFEVATIKLHKSGDEKQSMTYPANGFIATNVTLWMLLRVAYGVEDNQISGAQNWFNAESYDVEASVDRPVAEELRKLTRDQRAAKQQPMLQALLADRFKLALHRETKELPVYALVIAKDGPKLQEAKPGDTYSNGLKGLDGLPAGPNYTVMRRNQLTTQARPVLSLARDLSRVLGSPVLDKTGLTGNYDFTLHWTSDESLAGVFKGTGSSGTLSPDSSGPSIFTAVQEQLGLELKEQTAPAQVLVIDHAERPSGN